MGNRTTVTSVALSVAFVGFVSKSPGQVVIRPDKKITCITEPLDESGRVDYLEALNQRYSQGVTAATNWEIALLKEFGAPKLAPESLKELWRRLGIPPIHPDRDQPILQGYRFGDEQALKLNSRNNMKQISFALAAHYEKEQQWPEKLEDLLPLMDDNRSVFQNPITGDDPGYEYVKPSAALKEVDAANTIVLYQMRNGKRDTKLPVAYLDGRIPE